MVFWWRKGWGIGSRFVTVAVLSPGGLGRQRKPKQRGASSKSLTLGSLHCKHATVKKINQGNNPYQQQRFGTVSGSFQKKNVITSTLSLQGNKKH